MRDPRKDLTPTARRIVDAAQELLFEEGYGGLSFDKIAARAGANKTSIRYNFGNKDRLIAVVVDTIMYEDIMRGHALERDSEAGDPVQTTRQTDREIIIGSEAFRSFFSVFPQAIRDDDLRQRIARLYPQWYRRRLRQLGLPLPEDADEPQEIYDLGRLLTAVVDGLAVQYLLDPDRADPDGPLRVLQSILEPNMPALRDSLERGRETARGREAVAGEMERGRETDDD